jgi:periplasmic protein CpxP/Spy
MAPVLETQPSSTPRKEIPMRPWLKRTFIGLFGATVLFGGLAACSHGRYGMHGGAMSEEDAAQFRAKMVDRVGKELKLDEAQKQRLTALADKLREQRAALMSGANDPRAEVQALVAGPKFDRERAQGVVTAKTEALRGKSPEVIAAAADFYDSLNPEQQQKVRDFMARRGHGWRG